MEFEREATAERPARAWPRGIPPVWKRAPALFLPVASEAVAHCLAAKSASLSDSRGAVSRQHARRYSSARHAAVGVLRRRWSAPRRCGKCIHAYSHATCNAGARGVENGFRTCKYARARLETGDPARRCARSGKPGGVELDHWRLAGSLAEPGQERVPANVCRHKSVPWQRRLRGQAGCLCRR